MKKILVFLSAVIFLTSCSTYDYYSVSNRMLNPTKYPTYAWIPEYQSKADAAYNNDIATDKIVNAASEELNKRGYQLKNKNPDLLIKYTAVVKNETRTYNEPVYYNQPARLSPRFGYYNGRSVYYYAYDNPYPVYVGSRARKVQVKEGSVMIDIIDRKTSKLIWRGWAEGEVNNPQKAIDDIPTVVANIFKKMT